MNTDLFNDICEVCGNLETQYRLDAHYFCSLEHYYEFREKEGLDGSKSEGIRENKITSKTKRGTRKSKRKTKKRD